MKMAVYSVLQLSVIQTVKWLRRKRSVSVRAGIPAQSQQRKGRQRVEALERTQRIEHQRRQQQDHVGAAAQHGRQLEGLVESGSEGAG